MKRAAVGVGVVAALAAAVLLATQPWRQHRVQQRVRTLLVGLDDDTLKWRASPDSVLALQRAAGARAVRVWLPYHGGRRPRGVQRTYLARADEVARRGQRVVLAVFGFARDAPVATRAQRRFCGFAAGALVAAPHIHDVVVWNEANSPTYWPRRVGARGYASLLARCWDALHRVRPEVTVLDSTASAHDAAAFLRRLGASYRSMHRARPLVDAFGHNPYPAFAQEPPDARHRALLGEGDYPRLVRILSSAFAGTPSRGAPIWYLEDGFQTRVPLSRRVHYTGRETLRTLATAAQQATLVRDAVLLAACQPRVAAFFNFELTDEVRLAGWQSGLLWHGGRRKPAFTAFAEAARDAAAGRVDCSPVMR